MTYAKRACCFLVREGVQGKEAGSAAVRKTVGGVADLATC